ncbi:MAG TPA: HGGxSTG domain-containing protein [Candidatus Hydrogenedentes bacterium]|nr:HGGxSTG domain-containing protein [Candidatus Hydrogenedentota bacterium]
MNPEQTQSPAATPRRTTPLGTPCSPAWDDAHIAKVEALESQLNRPVCGARNLAGNPCTLAPNHENGRCRYHGGFNLTGAQPGNRNGVIHGLYARSIQTCGDHCPMWKTCPCAGPDILSLDARERPKCPYETAQYNASLTDALERAQSINHNDGLTQHTAHHVAMLHVMTMRAATAMAESPLKDLTLTTAKEFQRTDHKPSVYMQAYLRLSCELRQFAKFLDPKHRGTLDMPDKHSFELRAQHDTTLLPEDQPERMKARPESMKRAFKLFNNASYESTRGTPKKAREFLEKAIQVNPDYVATLLDPTGPLWDPAYENLRQAVNTS